MPKENLGQCKCLDLENKDEIIRALHISIEKQQDEIREITARAIIPSLVEPYRTAIQRIEKVKKTVENTSECK